MTPQNDHTHRLKLPGDDIRTRGTDYLCTVWKDHGGWFATFYDAGDIAREFGYNTLPLGFNDSASVESVVASLQEIHPQYRVFYSGDKDNLALDKE